MKKSAAIDTRDNLQIIQEGLSKYGGRQKVTGDWHMVQCGFHDDNTPSMGVYIRVGMKRPLGFISCLACGKKGRWNEFAKKEGLDEIKEWQTSEDEALHILTKQVEDNLLGSESKLTLEGVFEHMDCSEAMPWPEALEWRGYKGEFVKAMGGHIIEDNYADDIAVVFPIYIGKNVRGAVKAAMSAKKGRASYITMKGEWILKYGLFPYNEAAKLTKTKGYVVLVEGPRDAMRLIRLGIPALAVLGAGTFTKSKANLIRALNAQVFVMSDNDAAGKVMWLKVKSVMAEDNPKRLRLPEDKDETGKVIKMDPGNAPLKIIKQAKRLMEEMVED